ncbi:MAG: hypothetical protein IJ806_06625 [Ruminococcus sp.]|nr:hypothetical protein [Ruminococcus sp.]
MEDGKINIDKGPLCEDTGRTSFYGTENGKDGEYGINRNKMANIKNLKLLIFLSKKDLKFFIKYAIIPISIWRPVCFKS